MDGIYELVLRTPDGREQRQFALVPDDSVLQNYYDKARKNGLEIELQSINITKNRRTRI